MSDDELVVTVIAVVVGPLMWIWWLLSVPRVRLPGRRRPGPAAMAVPLLICTVLMFAVLKTAASADVVDAPQYLFMYVVLGLAWLRLVAALFPLAGLSARDDVVERGNPAARAAHIGALVGVTLCYAGGNIGNGPGWWVVVFSAALATATLVVLWGVLAQITPVADAVTIDRDAAAGWRLAAFLIACGLILGRGVAGDWESAATTVADFGAALPAAAAVAIVAIVVEWLARPTPQRPRPPVVAFGVLPSVIYLAIAIGAVRAMGWPA